MSVARKSARVLFWFHTILGIGSGLLMLALGISGTLLVYKTQIERVAFPHLYDIAPSQNRAALDALIQVSEATATSIAPGTKLSNVRLPKAADAPVEMQFRAKDQVVRVYTDPYSGRVLGSRTNDWMIAVYEFHHDFFAGQTGRFWLGILSWMLVVLTLTGAYTVLKRWSAMRVALTQPFAFKSLHYMAGTVMIPVLLIVALTGTSFTWGREYRAWLKQAFGNAEQQVAPKATEAPVQSFDLALNAAKQAMPDGRVTMVRVPAKPGDPLTVVFARNGDLRENGNTQVLVDGATGNVLRVNDRDARSTDVRIAESFMPLHTGEFGGGFTKFVWALSGVVQAGLFVSGLVVWVRRLRARPAVQPVERYAVAD